MTNSIPVVSLIDEQVMYSDVLPTDSVSNLDCESMVSTCVVSSSSIAFVTFCEADINVLSLS